jgi:hypothetical protein
LPCTKKTERIGHDLLRQFGFVEGAFMSHSDAQKE